MNVIRCPLFDSAIISKHETALVSGHQAMIFSDVDEMAARAARNLRRMGVEPGMRLAIYLENSWQYVAILWGCWRAGVVACPLNTRLPREAVFEQIRHIGAPALVARVSNPKGESTAALRVISPDELLVYRERDDDEVEGWPMSLDAPATILFTSGSSGAPKAAEHSIANHYYNARASNKNVRLSSHDAWLLSLPLFHVGGIGVLFRCALAGAAVIVPEAGESIEAAQERYGVTHLSLVATQLYRLLNSEKLPASFAKLKTILLGGSGMPPALLVEAMRRRWPVYTSYGMTEMASQVCTMGPASPPAKRMTSGRALGHCEVRIATDGEIWVRGRTLFRGYVTASGRQLPVDEEGWFATGDLGALDEEGYLTVRGRKDNLFISGGENIQPEEVENWLASFPEVAAAVVVPRSDEEFGARPVAFLQWRGDAVSDEELRARLEKILPRYKIPASFRAWPDASGEFKIDRRRFEQLAASEV
ncbi:MAG: o-succinylbenzoate--CoA ligase [Kiritimatiellae bacterium]|nr:o-succinylbenzoate--CoA ligase [Kiritimatiellia bacterium]